MGQLEKRVEERARDWGVVVQDTLETQSSFIAFGKRGDQPVVLKVARQPGDEWRCGAVMDEFGGRGMARVYERIEGAALIERLKPGASLASVALNDRDEEATEILADVIDRMSRPRESSDDTSREALKEFVSAQDWGKGFERYLASGDHQIPTRLVEQARQLYFDLCASQRGVRLLHGDLQHYNVLFDSDRGWLAIDPKGVIGEVEYEIGASLRNPYEKPEMFASAETVERRLRCFKAKLGLNSDRALAWGFAQAVLSAIWSVEDGFAVDAGNPSLRLANAIWPILK
ncbi:MAG TPA: aminoglycoside phosphotransferase family protein [Blastocatellia bacterium]|jgi:streptomycin 6-kinase|nr:aminoglycoside phosphotransferase family protein [Blastocatellia bacterium]